MVDNDDHLIHKHNHTYKMVVDVDDDSVYNHNHSDNRICMMNYLQSHSDNHIDNHSDDGDDDEVLRKYSKVCEEMMGVLYAGHNRIVPFLNHNHNNSHNDNPGHQIHYHEDACDVGSVHLYRVDNGSHNHNNDNNNYSMGIWLAQDGDKIFCSFLQSTCRGIYRKVWSKVVFCHYHL